MEKIVDEFEQIVIQTRTWQQTPDKPVHFEEQMKLQTKFYAAGEALKKLMKGPEPEATRKKQTQRWYDLSREFNRNVMATWEKAKQRLESGMYGNVFGK